MTPPPTVVVTGGCGFIGVNLGRLLGQRGWRLVAFDNLTTGTRRDGESAGYDVLEGDVRDLDALTRAVVDADYVVHLAAHTDVVESVEDPAHDVDINVTGVLNALLASRAAGVAGFAFASSNAPLGETDPPSREDKVPQPLSPYGASKLAGEALCSSFSGSYGLATTVLRFSNVYGPFSYHKGSVVALFLREIMNGRGLTVYGDGEQTRDFVYVDDLCRGIVLALESGLAGETFHLGSGTETSVNELVTMINQLFPSVDVSVTHLPERAGEIRRNYSDITKARDLLGFDPHTDLLSGLERTRDWFVSAYGGQA